MPAGSPRDALAFLMLQHGLKQADLSSLARQGAVSEILSGKRGISKRLAVRLAAHFAVSPAVFI